MNELKRKLKTSTENLFKKQQETIMKQKSKKKQTTNVGGAGVIKDSKVDWAE